jgi:cyclopropane-fatty-acyl-phospholipid synthase
MYHASKAAASDSPSATPATGATTSRAGEQGTTDVSTARIDAPNGQAASPSRQGQAPVRPWHRYLMSRVLSVIGKPPLAAALWDGQPFCASERSPLATIVVHNAATLRRIAMNPFFQFAEAYANGQIDIIGDLVETIVAVNHSIRSSAQASFLYKVVSHWLRLPRWHSLSASRDNVYHHYDIGNDFYRLWLDEQLAYTCAYFPSPEVSLEAAQVAKFDHVCRKVQLRPGESVVEAGCGWGALALHMARNYGVKVKAYNVSHEQVAYARQRAHDEGLADRVEFVEDDWRHITGRYDAFMSVGMLEHVGKGNYARLGEVIHRSLNDKGRGLVHSIGRNRPAPVDRWIERRIFPGSYPPSLGEMMQIFEPRRFSVLDVENLRLHYAQTLRHWLARFESASERIRQMFDDRFARMWRLYLAGSVAAFETGELQLFQVVFARGESNDIPWTRSHLYGDAACDAAPAGA